MGQQLKYATRCLDCGKILREHNTSKYCAHHWRIHYQKKRINQNGKTSRRNINKNK
jgi:rRNA maturation endonuclease Nob1